jgi:hypothetical protein
MATIPAPRCICCNAVLINEELARNALCCRSCNEKAKAELEAIAKEQAANEAADAVNHPKHYCAHPSGIECIQITEHMNFCLGNAVKYIFRADEKGKPVEDLKKALWYIQREIERRERAS